MKKIVALALLGFLTFGLEAQVSFNLSATLSSGHNPTSVVTADVNGDGKSDLICANSADSTLSVLTNNGSGVFVLKATPGVGSGPIAVTAADVNGDGRMDLITANVYDNTLTVMTNDGSGGFVLASSPQVGNVPYAVLAADVNGDGKMDLISANLNSDTLTVLTNNGHAGFVLANTLPVGNEPISVAATDVNGDQRMDLICANQGANGSGNTLSVLTNDGHGGFILVSTPTVGGGVYCVVAADLNGDGKVDLVSANPGGNSLSVLTNTGSGGFVTSGTYGVGQNPISVVAADISLDGKLDLICANSNDNSLTVLTNDGSGGFQIATTLNVNSTPYSVIAVDVNGDGKLDLISANLGANNLSVFTNATPFPALKVPPVITFQPTGLTNVVGATAVFSVTATNANPNLAYQWQFTGTNLPAATNQVLVLNNLTLSQSGNYDVVVANSFGSVTSSPALLDVRFILIKVNGQPTGGTASAVGSATVTITGGYSGGFLFYTLDGSTPNTSSALYTGVLTLNNPAVISVMALSADFSQASFSAPVNLNIVPGYNVQTSVSGNGTVTLNPASGPYLSNSVVTLTAVAAQYWVFDHWAGSASGSQNPLNLTINGPGNVQAVFLPTAYPVTADTLGGGGVTVNGQVISPGTYFPSGSTLTLAATATGGWSFVGWQGDANGTNNPLVVTVQQTNNIHAIFGTMVGTNATGGGLIALSQPNPVPFGTTLTASAVPSAGKYFVVWSGVASGTNAPTTISVTNPTPTINGLFAALPGGKYALGVVVVGNGGVTTMPQQNYYNAGTSVSLTATTTNAGTRFYGWTGDVVDTNSSIAVVMNASHTVQANFGGPLTVSISPASLDLLQGGNGVLTANASGLTPLSYQWQDSVGAISGATNASFSIHNAQGTNAGNYSVVVSNPFGSVTSSVVTVTVYFPPAITLQPVSQTVAAGTPATLSVTASGTLPLAYQWWNSLGPILGATNSNFSLNPAKTNNWDNYFVLVTNVYGAATSTVTPLVVYGPVTVNSEPMSQVVPLGGLASFTVFASGFPAPVYQWTFNGAKIPGATSSSLTVSNVDVPNLGNYQVLINNGYSTNNSYVVTLNSPPDLISPFRGAATIWGAPATFSVGAVGSGPIYYQWYKDGQVIAGANGPTLNFTSIQFTNAGLYSVVVSSTYGTVTNGGFEVVVNPANVSLGFYPGLTIGGVVGFAYIIQSSTNLADPNAWVTQTNLVLTTPVQLWIDTNVDASSPFNPKTFYKILPGQ